MIFAMEERSEAGSGGLLSRRDFAWIMMTAFGGSSILLSGCGGSSGGMGGGSGGGLRSLSGSITLPAGVAAKDVIISSTKGLTPLTEAAYEAVVSAAAPSLVMALDSVTKKVLAMAMVNPDDAKADMNSNTTAAALIYLGLGGSAFIGNDRKTLLKKVVDSSETSALAAAIRTAQGSDKFALSNGNADLKAKVQSAIRAVNTGFSRAAVESSSEIRTNGLSPMMIIEPAAAVDGFTVVQTSPGLGFQVQNERRRSATAFTYIVGHVAPDGKETSENPPKRVGAPLYVPATKNILSLPYGWSQVVSSPMSLSLSGSDKTTKFETVIISTAFKGNVPAFYSDPRFASHVQSWKDEAARLRQTGIIQGMANLVLEVLGLGGALFEYSTLSALIPQVLAKTTAIRAGLLAAAEGNIFYEFVLQELLKDFTAEALFALELPIIEPLIAQVSAVRAAELFAGQSSAASIAVVRAGMVVLIALGVIEVADIIAVARDTRSGPEANLWQLTAFQPTVQMNPPSGTYQPGSSLQISVTAPGIGTQGIAYKWTLTGSSLANISDGTQVGASFTSTKSVVTLATTPSTVGTLSLTAVITKNGVEVGSATAKFTLATGQPMKFVEIPYGPRLNFPTGGGFLIAYHEIPLHASARTKVRLKGVNNRPGYDGARAEMTVSFPPKSTPIYPVDQEIVAAQNINTTLLRNQGFISGESWTRDDWTTSQAFRFVNYGDRVLVWLALSNWMNNPGTSGFPGSAGESRTRLNTHLAQFQFTTEILP